MPTTRTRKPRPSALLPEHVAWAESADAADFFERTYDYAAYGEISILPGVRPWWECLPLVWDRRDEGPPAETAGTAAHTTWPQALAFVQALHTQYLTSRRRK